MRRNENALPFAFPEATNCHRVALQGDVCDVERDQFRDAEAGGIEDFDQGSVAQASRIRDVRRVQQVVHLGCGQEARQRLERARRLQFLGRILMHVASPPQAERMLRDACFERMAHLKTAAGYPLHLNAWIVTGRR